MRELTVQGANDTLQTADRQAISDEMNQLSSEVDRIANTTQFNGITLLNGSASNINLQIGANAGQTMTVSISAMDATTLGVGSASLQVATAASCATTLTAIDTAIGSVSAQRSLLGAAQNRLEHTISNLGVAEQNLTASQSRIADVDMAAEMVNFTKTGILQQAGQAILAQANQAPSGILSLLRG
jgi:flagellin